MGIKRVVNVDFWKDDEVAERYTPEERYFFLYLLTNPNTKQCGIYHLPIRTMTFELGFTSEKIKALLDKFENQYKNIVYSYTTNEVAILNFLKHSIIKGGKPVEDCLRKELEEVKDKKLITKVYEHMLQHMDEQIKFKEENGSTSMYAGIKIVFQEILHIDHVKKTYEDKKAKIYNVNNYEQRKNQNFDKLYIN